MFNHNVAIEPVDYLVIGHITQDVTPNGPVLGGTASYAALTARAMGLRVGIVTAFDTSTITSIPELSGIGISAAAAEATTTFENIYTPEGRIQYLHHRAPSLDISHVPETWRNAPIVHLGPVANEVEPNIIRSFGDSFIGLTPQGWLRDWDGNHRVYLGEWPEARFVLEKAGAAVISIEDLHGDESRIDEMASSIRVLAVTEGAAGCRVYWNGDVRRFRPPSVSEIDSTGAGDIFAAAFFCRMVTTRDPWESARFANQLAALSVTRRGLTGIPTPDEVQGSQIEVIRGY
jgi:hypothetical protein